jgi:hypothetical protein
VLRFYGLIDQITIPFQDVSSRLHETTAKSMRLAVSHAGQLLRRRKIGNRLDRRKVAKSPFQDASPRGRTVPQLRAKLVTKS